jgi:hypothetical protein
MCMLPKNLLYCPYFINLKSLYVLSHLMQNILVIKVYKFLEICSNNESSTKCDNWCNRLTINKLTTNSL